MNNPATRNFFIADSFARRRISLGVGQCRFVTAAPRYAPLWMHLGPVGADDLLGDIAPAMVGVIEVLRGLGGQLVQHEIFLRAKLATERGEQRAGRRDRDRHWRLWFVRHRAPPVLTLLGSSRLGERPADQRLGEGYFVRVFRELSSASEGQPRP